MGDVVKALVSAPANAVLLVAGLAFLAIAVFRRVTDRLDAGPRGRLFAGVLGLVLVGLSLSLSIGDSGKSPRTPSPASPTPVAPEAGGSAAAPAAPAPESDGAFPIALPAGQVVKGDDHTYTILEIALDRHEIDQRALTFTIRMQNDSPYPANFWNASFRLLVDGVPQEPFTTLNELVDGNAAKEGTVSFALPAGTRTVSLQVERFGADALGLPISLPAGN